MEDSIYISKEAMPALINKMQYFLKEENIPGTYLIVKRHEDGSITLEFNREIIHTEDGVL